MAVVRAVVGVVIIRVVPVAVSAPAPAHRDVEPAPVASVGVAVHPDVGVVVADAVRVVVDGAVVPRAAPAVAPVRPLRAVGAVVGVDRGVEGRVGVAVVVGRIARVLAVVVLVVLDGLLVVRVRLRLGLTRAVVVAGDDDAVGVDLDRVGRCELGRRRRRGRKRDGLRLVGGLRVGVFRDLEGGREPDAGLDGGGRHLGLGRGGLAGRRAARRGGDQDGPEREAEWEGSSGHGRQGEGGASGGRVRVRYIHRLCRQGRVHRR